MMHTLRIAPPPWQLIINADDLGIGEARDTGILEAFAKHAISSASLLVNGGNARQAAAQAAAAGLPLGLHLNLTEGSPQARQQHSSLADATGRLRGKFGLRSALASGEIRAADLAAEIRAQFDTFIALTGELPSHLDGHHHIHIESAVAEVLAPIMAHEYGVYCCRLPVEQALLAATPMDTIPPADTDFDPAFHLAIAHTAATSRHFFAAQGIYSPEAFLGQSFMGTRLQAASLAAALSALQASAPTSQAAGFRVELMTHPGRIAHDTASDAFCRSAAREHELRTLQSTGWRAAIAGWELISYRQLLRPADSPLGNQRPTILIYSKLKPATGNAETARRYAAAWSPIAEIRFRPLLETDQPAALQREARRLQEFAACEHLDVAFGIHLYRAGSPLAAAFGQPSPSLPPLPIGLLASGTDANSDIDHPGKRAAIGQALQSADFLFCLSSDLHARLAGMPLPDDTCVLPNGIDIRTSSSAEPLAALGLAADATLILFPSSLRRLKGVLPLVETLAPVLAEKYPTHVLLVLGPPLEADYAAELRARIRSLTAEYPSLEQRIVLHDGLPHADYLAALKTAALVLNASEHEGLSHGLMEAMAAGIPVLARDIPGNRQLIRHGETGRLFADFSTLAATYAACFGDVERSRQMARCAQAEVTQRYSLAAEQSRLCAALEHCLAQRQTRLQFYDAGHLTTLRLDLAPETHPASPENMALFSQIDLSGFDRASSTPLNMVVDVGCGSGVFGFHLLHALARQGRRASRMVFADPHQPSLAALTRTLTRHRQQLPMLDTALLSDGSLLEPLLQAGERAELICANLPQTPGPDNFRLDRCGGRDGAELLCTLIEQLPRALADNGLAFILHIGLANPTRVHACLKEHGLQATIIAEQQRHAQLADYEAMHAGLAAYLEAEQAAGRSEFSLSNNTIEFTARLLCVRWAR